MGAPRNQSIHASSFLMGAVTGGAIATGLALFFSPRLTEARERLASYIAAFRDTASERLQSVENQVADVLDRAADVADDLATRTEAVRDDVAKVVEEAAHTLSQEVRKVERFAKASQTSHHEKHA